MIDWTEEEIAKRSVSEIKVLRENAARIGQQQVVSLCDLNYFEETHQSYRDL